MSVLSTPMNASQVRVIDPILSNVALGFKNSSFIGTGVAPIVPVSISGGQVLQFGKEAFQAFNLRRAPRTPGLSKWDGPTRSATFSVTSVSTLTGTT